jgi:hypothetical protein
MWAAGSLKVSATPLFPNAPGDRERARQLLTEAINMCGQMLGHL